MGWRGRGEVQLIFEVVFVLPLPLQAHLLPEAGGREPAAQHVCQAGMRKAGATSAPEGAGNSEGF